MGESLTTIECLKVIREYSKMSAKSCREITETTTWLLPQLLSFTTLNESEILASRKSSYNQFNFDLKVTLSYLNSTPRFTYYIQCRDKVYIKLLKYILFKNDYLTTSEPYIDTPFLPNKWYALTSTTMTSNEERICWKKITVEFKILTEENPVITLGRKSEAECQNFLQESRLISDLGNLLSLGTFSDAVIKSTDGYEYKVHKAFLSCRSDVLKAHFDHNTSESDSNILESPFESKVLEEVLTFVYIDQSLKVAEMPEILLNAANFYQLDRLKGFCEKALYKKLNVKNAIEILTLADMHSCKNLEKSVMEFIKDNFTLITKTQGWVDFNSPEKIKSITEYVMKNN